MKTNLFFFFALVFLLAAGCTKDVYDLPVGTPSTEAPPVNQAHPMKDSINAIVGRYIAKGIPGIQVAVKNADGWYFANGGYARIEDQRALSSEMVNWYFSLTKIYTAALIMKEWESENINLELPIDNYLPQEVAAGIEGSDRITIRMLLNHTSGIVNLTELPEYQLWQLNRPLEQPTVEERLAMVYGKPLMFEPGSDFSYSNTNYLLLQNILEQVSRHPYESLLRSKILAPLHLNHTYYNLPEAQARQLSFPNYYFDRYANEQLENVSEWNLALANASDGYGGIAGTPADAIRFLEALVGEEVVSPASLDMMYEWVQGRESTQPDYGMGLEYYQFAPGLSQGQYGHEGDGIGCTTQVMYVPENNTYLYINCTVGRQIFGPYLFKVTDFKNELCGYVAKWR